MGTLLEQIAAIVATLNEVKALCETIVAASAKQATDYAAAEAAQDTAGVSSSEIVALAQQVIAKIGAVA
jgi:hypothetical protein